MLFSGENIMAVMLECDVLRNARENLGFSAGQIANKANRPLAKSNYVIK